MTDANVVHLHNPIAHARAVKNRLWNPPNGRQSSEREVASAAQLKQQRLDADRARQDYRRAAALDDMLREALVDHINAKEVAFKLLVEPPGPPKVKVIISLVAHEYDVTSLDILSQRRNPSIAEPRHVAMYLARKLTPKSMPEIGLVFGRRDHTTILHAIRKIEARMDRDPKFKLMVLDLQGRLAAA